MKVDIKQNGMWWDWIETCDRCGELIYDHSFQHSCEPDVEEADFCVKCLRYFLDNDIPYAAAKKQYKK